MDNYTVYKHTSPNGKVYIGITCKPTKARWKNGKGYKNNDYFYNAILKYGWENFSHEEKYASAHEAGRSLNVQYQKVWAVCEGRRKSTGGYHFKWA